MQSHTKKKYNNIIRYKVKNSLITLIITNWFPTYFYNAILSISRKDLTIILYTFMGAVWHDNNSEVFILRIKIKSIYNMVYKKAGGFDKLQYSFIILVSYYGENYSNISMKSLQDHYL